MNTDELIGQRENDFHFLGTCVVTLQDSTLILVGMRAWYSLPTCCSSESGVASETSDACVSGEARGTSETCNSRRSVLPCTCHAIQNRPCSADEVPHAYQCCR